jgi:hypothetical protein
MNNSNNNIVLNAKHIDIVEFLRKYGIVPTRETCRFALFHAPYRIDRHPSMVVNKEKNRWSDLAQNIGGDIIDLVKLVCKVDFSSALNILLGDVSPHIIPKFVKSQAACISNDIQVNRLSNRKLISYLSSRMIDLDVARKYCVEVYYMHNGRKYFAVGFRNIIGGYETRNEYFKRCIGAKAISLIRQDYTNNICLIFEGFIDFLSYVTMTKAIVGDMLLTADMDVIVLNTVAMVRQAIPYLKQYTTVKCYLDNDDAGRTAYAEIASQIGNAIDCSTEYADYKDVNEWLCGRQNKIGHQ